MYSKVFKNNQITYGMPFQIRIPLNFQSIQIQENNDELIEISVKPEGKENHEDILRKAREEAEMIIKEAEYEALQIFEETKKEAETRVYTAEEEAKQKGYNDGLEAARELYEEIIRDVEAVKESAMEEHDKVLAGMETEIIGMVMEIAKKVIGEELELNKENMIFLVKQTLEKCSNKNNVILKVSSNEYEYIIENKNNLLSLLEGMSDIEIKQDLSLKAGACVIETAYGNVDAGAQTRLRKIEEAFMEILEGR